jgi:hypothetical protein
LDDTVPQSIDAQQVACYSFLASRTPHPFLLDCFIQIFSLFFVRFGLVSPQAQD